jgi:hypothetical protein
MPRPSRFVAFELERVVVRSERAWVGEGEGFDGKNGS